MQADNLRIFERLYSEQYPPALEAVNILASEFQGVLNEFDDEIEILENLIEEHASDNTKEELMEEANGFRIILGSQISIANTELEQFGMDPLIR